MLHADIILFLALIAVLVKSADYAIKYSHSLSKLLKLQDFVISFFLVSIVSVLPETSISIISALAKTPQFGLGTILGSTVADLTLVIGIVTLFSRDGIKVQSTIMKNNMFLLLLVAFPFILGFDGNYSRTDGAILLLIGIMFLSGIFLKTKKFKREINEKSSSLLKSFFLLLLSLLMLVLSAKYVVDIGVKIAGEIGLPIALISLTFVSLGVCLPETIFSIESVKKNLDSLALGDILGTVTINVTIVLGLTSIISPFTFDYTIIRLAGVAMLASSMLVFIFMKTEKRLTKTEGVSLILFYVLYIILQLLMHKML